MAKVNYHTHTYRCQHANGDIDDYVESAIANGFTTLGFSDHTPWFYKDGYTSRIRMLPSQFSDYMDKINQAKVKYHGKIDIYSGLEVEYHIDKLSWLIQLAKEHDLDYMILGNHSYPHDEYDKVDCHDFFGTKTIEDIHLYVNVLIKAIESGLFSYIAHPEVFMRGYQQVNDAVIDAFQRIIDCAKDHDMILEYNLNGLPWDKTYGIHTYPHPLFWQMAGQAGCKAVVGYDAHFPQALSQWEDDYHQGMTLLNESGCTIVDTIPLGCYKRGKVSE